MTGPSELLRALRQAVRACADAGVAPADINAEVAAAHRGPLADLLLSEEKMPTTPSELATFIDDRIRAARIAGMWEETGRLRRIADRYRGGPADIELTAEARGRTARG